MVDGRVPRDAEEPRRELVTRIVGVQRAVHLEKDVLSHVPRVFRVVRITLDEPAQARPVLVHDAGEEVPVAGQDEPDEVGVLPFGAALHGGIVPQPNPPEADRILFFADESPRRNAWRSRPKPPPESRTGAAGPRTRSTPSRRWPRASTSRPSS